MLTSFAPARRAAVVAAATAPSAATPSKAAKARPPRRSPTEPLERLDPGKAACTSVTPGTWSRASEQAELLRAQRRA
jgi:hypothetical protein